jgi:hypothetical protein
MLLDSSSTQLKLLFQENAVILKEHFMNVGMGTDLVLLSDVSDSCRMRDVPDMKIATPVFTEIQF